MDRSSITPSSQTLWRSRSLRPSGSSQGDTTSVDSAKKFTGPPRPIPPAKFDKAVLLYRKYKQVPDDDQLPAEWAPAPEKSRAGRSTTLVNAEPDSAFESVLSFAGTSQPSGELVTFDGKTVQPPRQRSRFPPRKLAKTNLIRHLGACAECHNSRTPCELEHHDIAALDKQYRNSEGLETEWNSKSERQSYGTDHIERGWISDDSQLYEPLPLTTGGSAAHGISSFSQSEALLGLNLDQSPHPLSTGADVDLYSHNEITSPGFLTNPHYGYGMPGTSTSMTHTPYPSELHPQQIPQPSHSHDVTVPASTQASGFRNVLHPEVYSNKHPSGSDFLTTSTQLNDWKSELRAAVESAFEAAYGPGPIFDSLQLALQSIFGDPTLPSISNSTSSHGSVNAAHGSIQQGGPSEAFQSAPGNFTDGGGGNFRLPGSIPEDLNLDRDNRREAKVKSGKPEVNPSARVLRRLLCHFHARYPHVYCATPITGNKYHLCAKSGYLTIAHLKQHFKSIHTASQCTRCGELFSRDAARDEHYRADRQCQLVSPIHWPIHKAANIDGEVQDRITSILSARGLQSLHQNTKHALEDWVSANITTYVGNNPSSQERLELRNWYLIWLALFPDVPVPPSPFSPGPATASEEDERFIEVLRNRVQASINSGGRMRGITSDHLEVFVDCLRESWGDFRAVPQTAPSPSSSVRSYSRQLPQSPPSPSLSSQPYVHHRSQSTGRPFIQTPSTPLSTRQRPQIPPPGFGSHQRSYSTTTPITPITPSTGQSAQLTDTRPQKRARSNASIGTPTSQMQHMNFEQQNRTTAPAPLFPHHNPDPRYPAPDMGSFTAFQTLPEDEFAIPAYLVNDGPWSGVSRSQGMQATSRASGTSGFAPHGNNPMVSGDDTMPISSMPVLYDHWNSPEFDHTGQFNEEGEDWRGNN